VSIVFAVGATIGIWAGISAVSAPPHIEHDALGYLVRSSGLVLLALFTATVVLGQLTAARVSAPRWPRFVMQSLHRNLSVLSLLLLAIHVAAPIVGGYLGLKLAYAFVPFVAAPVRVWTRAAACATDLTLLVAAVSALRVRAGYRFWRAVHLMSYAAWILAIVHGTGIGSDRGAVLWCDAVSVGTVAVASSYRVATARRLMQARAP
jgi:predicted ferric reductase